MSYEWGEHSHQSRPFNTSLHEFIIDLKREGGTDIISDPKMVLTKIYSTSLLSKYSTNNYE